MASGLFNQFFMAWYFGSSALRQTRHNIFAPPALSCTKNSMADSPYLENKARFAQTRLKYAGDIGLAGLTKYTISCLTKKGL
jgi:hypothetical protein